MGKKKFSAGLGKAISNAQKKVIMEKAQRGRYNKANLEGQEFGISCLEATNLDEFLATAELSNQKFDAIRGRTQLFDKQIVSKQQRQEGMDFNFSQYGGVLIPIPRRPRWDDVARGDFVVPGEESSEEEDEENEEDAENGGVETTSPNAEENEENDEEEDEEAAALAAEIAAKEKKKKQNHQPKAPAPTSRLGKKLELERRENESFLDWRKKLANLEEEHGFVMTPFERNIDFWRQLWRVVEKSDVIVQILDCRDPLFYRSVDLENYVQEVAEVQNEVAISESQNRKESQDSEDQFGGDFGVSRRRAASDDSDVPCVKKASCLILNKADYMPEELRREWKQYFQERNVEVVFFSALWELEKLEINVDSDMATKKDGNKKVAADEVSEEEEKDSENVVVAANTDVLNCDQLMDFLRLKLESVMESMKPKKDTSLDDVKLLDKKTDENAIDMMFADEEAEFERELRGENNKPRGTIGFCGYPNVGKSSIINALFGAKKASMSRQPGKTKHFQTLEMNDFTLCDCPGLVMPLMVATKSHLVVNGVMAVDQLRDFLSPLQLIVSKVGTSALYEHYGVNPLALRGDQTRRFLCSFASQRGHFLRDKVPDETWAARRCLADFCTGSLLYCERPPVDATTKKGKKQADAHPGAAIDFETLAGSSKKEALAQIEESKPVVLSKAPLKSDAKTVVRVEAEKPAAVVMVPEYDSFADWNPTAEELSGAVAEKAVTKRALRKNAKQAQKGTTSGKKGRKCQAVDFGLDIEHEL